MASFCQIFLKDIAPRHHSSHGPASDIEYYLSRYIYTNHLQGVLLISTYYCFVSVFDEVYVESIKNGNTDFYFFQTTIYNRKYNIFL